jgi:3-polyprenyl-4-hydroxybenzoate decarboxylase
MDQVDTGSVQTIVGVVTQGRQESNQWVSAYRIQVSDDNKNW